MGIFGKKVFVLGIGAYNVVRDCLDSKGCVDDQRLADEVRKAEEDLYAPKYAPNRAHFGSEMRAYAAELRSVLEWLVANPGKRVRFESRGR